MINGISDPYEISASLVQLEKDLQQLHQTYTKHGDYTHSYLKSWRPRLLLGQASTFRFDRKTVRPPRPYCLAHTVVPSVHSSISY